MQISYTAMLLIIGKGLGTPNPFEAFLLVAARAPLCLCKDRPPDQNFAKIPQEEVLPYCRFWAKEL